MDKVCLCGRFGGWFVNDMDEFDKRMQMVFRTDVAREVRMRL